MARRLKPWPNGLGYDYGDWELVKRSDGTWRVARKPKSFGQATHVGDGATWKDALLAAKPTEEYQDYLAATAEAR